LNSNFKSLLAEITDVVNNASFNGVNMIDSSGTTVYALSSDSGTKVTVAAQSLAVGGTNITISATASFATAAAASAYVATLTTDIANVNTALSALGSGASTLSNQLKFVSGLQDSLNTGISNLVDADMAAESAQLQALQTKQQLGIQALSIANQSTSALLSLFR
jgi:flagellin